MSIRLLTNPSRYKIQLTLLLFVLVLVINPLFLYHRQANASEDVNLPKNSNETIMSDENSAAGAEHFNEEENEEEIFLESMEDLHHVTYLSMLNYNITDKGLLESSALIGIGNAVGAHKQHQKTLPPASSESESDNKIRLALMLESFILHLRNGHLERVGLEDLKQMVENLNITHIYEKLHQQTRTSEYKHKLVASKLVSSAHSNITSSGTVPSRPRVELNTAERCNYLLALYKYELREEQNNLLDQSLQTSGNAPEPNQIYTSLNNESLLSQVSGAIEREQAAGTQIRNSSLVDGFDSETEISNARLRGLCRLVVDCLSADELVKVISGPWIDEMQEDKSQVDPAAVSSTLAVTDKLVDEADLTGKRQRILRESLSAKNSDQPFRSDRLQQSAGPTVRTLRDSLSKSIAKLCPLMLFQLHDNEETCTFKREDRPSMLTIWGFATLFVTIICFCSLIGLAIIPLIGGNQSSGSSIEGSETKSSDSSESEMMSDRRLPQSVTQTQYHKASLTLFEGLAVGSLVGSALFSLIPQAFELQERESNQSFLLKAFIIFSGIYLFFCSERIMRIILDTRQKQKRQMRHVNHRSSNSIQPLAANATMHSGTTQTTSTGAMLRLTNNNNNIRKSNNICDIDMRDDNNIIGHSGGAKLSHLEADSNLRQSRSHQVWYRNLGSNKSNNVYVDIDNGLAQSNYRTNQPGANEPTKTMSKRDTIRRRWRAILVSRRANIFAEQSQESSTGSRAVHHQGQSEFSVEADEKEQKKKKKKKKKTTTTTTAKKKKAKKNASTFSTTTTATATTTNNNANNDHSDNKSAIPLSIVPSAGKLVDDEEEEEEEDSNQRIQTTRQLQQEQLALLRQRRHQQQRWRRRGRRRRRIGRRLIDLRASRKSKSLVGDDDDDDDNSVAVGGQLNERVRDQVRDTISRKARDQSNQILARRQRSWRNKLQQQQDYASLEVIQSKEDEDDYGQSSDQDDYRDEMSRLRDEYSAVESSLSTPNADDDNDREYDYDSSAESSYSQLSSLASTSSTIGSLKNRKSRRQIRLPHPRTHLSRAGSRRSVDTATSGRVAFKQQQQVHPPELSGLTDSHKLRTLPARHYDTSHLAQVGPLPSPTMHHSNRYSGGAGNESPANYQRDISTVAWMIVLGDGLHNFIDGISIGAAFSESILSGVSISVAVICEEFPHELGDFAVLVSSGMTVREALGYNFLSACTCYFGMAVGIVLGDVNDAASYVSALAAGVFLYIALVDMMGELSATLEETSRDSITRTLKLLLLQNLGIFVGISIIFVLSFIDF